MAEHGLSMDSVARNGSHQFTRAGFGTAKTAHITPALSLLSIYFLQVLVIEDDHLFDALSLRLVGLESDCSALDDETASDELSMDLVGSFPNLGDLGITHQSFNADVLAVPVPAEELHGVRSHAHRQVRCAHLQDGSLYPEIHCAAVDHSTDRPQPAFGQYELRGEVGQHELNALEFDHL